jgi:atypical dual specificity phosphatase
MAVRPFDWLEPQQIGACEYPREEASLVGLARRGVSLLVNLHTRAHDPALLARHGLVELHLPVPDWAPPTPEQIVQGVEAIERARAEGRRVAVHCAAGLGRTGTLLACYLVRRGLAPADAIARVRAARPGSVESAEQAEAVAAYAQSLRSD